MMEEEEEGLTKLERHATREAVAEMALFTSYKLQVTSYKLQARHAGGGGGDGQGGGQRGRPRAASDRGVVGRRRNL